MKKRILIFLAIITIIAVIPVFPVRPTNPEWSTTEFENKKLELQRATDKINLWTSQLREHPNYKDIETYNVTCRIGKGTVYRSLLGFEVGTNHTNKYAFGTWAIPTIPHLEYSTHSTAFLNPSDFDSFIAWVDKRDNYASLPEQLR